MARNFVLGDAALILVMDVSEEEVGRHAVEQLLQDNVQEILDRLHQDGMQRLGDRPPVRVDVRVRGLLCMNKNRA